MVGIVQTCAPVIVPDCPDHQNMHNLVGVEPVVERPSLAWVGAAEPLLRNAQHIDDGAACRQNLQGSVEVGQAHPQADSWNCLQLPRSTPS